MSRRSRSRAPTSCSAPPAGAGRTGRDELMAPRPLSVAPDPAHRRSVPSVTGGSADDGAGPAVAQRGPSDRPAALQAGPGPAPSGRERHDEKITVYLSPDELVDLEQARLALRQDHGLAVDRGRIVREACRWCSPSWTPGRLQRPSSGGCARAERRPVRYRSGVSTSPATRTEGRPCGRRTAATAGRTARRGCSARPAGGTGSGSTWPTSRARSTCCSG